MRDIVSACLGCALPYYFCAFVFVVASWLGSGLSLFGVGATKPKPEEDARNEQQVYTARCSAACLSFGVLFNGAKQNGMQQCVKGIVTSVQVE